MKNIDKQTLVEAYQTNKCISKITITDEKIQRDASSIVTTVRLQFA